MRSERPRTLAFDTSAAHCAAVLLSGDRVAARRFEPMERGQAERLMPMLEEMLGEAGTSWRDLDAVAVCTGPGNFTGCRIGVAAARGLAFGLGVPAIGVSAFEALAGTVDGAALACWTDRKGQVFAQPWRHGASLGPPTADLGTPAGLPGNAVCVGTGAAVAAAALGLAEGTATAAEEFIVALARTGARRAGTPQPPPAPLYLRPPDAAPPAELAPATVDDA